MPAYGYTRISKAEAGGLSPAAQERAIRAAHPDVAEVILDDGVSGSVPLDQRPSGVVGRLKRGDTLVAVRLDRLFRSAPDALKWLDLFNGRGVAVVLLDLKLDFASPIGRLVYTVMAACAELERNMTRQRTKDALAELKAQGKPYGQPSYLSQPGAPARLEAARAELAAGSSLAQAARRAGIPPSTLRRLVKS